MYCIIICVLFIFYLLPCHIFSTSWVKIKQIKAKLGPREVPMSYIYKYAYLYIRKHISHVGDPDSELSAQFKTNDLPRTPYET